MVVVIDSSVPRRVARFQPVWRKCMTTTRRPVSTMVLIGLSETNTIGFYGHFVLRLMGCFVLFYTSRVVCKGWLAMEELIFSLKHYWRFVDCEALELKALSQGVDEKAA